MQKDIQTKFYLLAGIFGALFWSIADMLLVGFIPQADRYNSFLKPIPKDINADIIILMLDAPNWRLMWGVYLATFSLFLYIISTYGIYKLLPQKVLSKIAVFALFIGYCVSPIGHTSFAYIGLLSKTIYKINAINLEQILLLRQFEHLLNLHWIVSVSFSAFGWLIILILTLKKQFLSLKVAFLNPIISTLLIGYITSLFPFNIVAVMLGCACLNISQLIFFTYLYILHIIYPSKI